MSSMIRFLLNGKAVAISGGLAPTTTVLNYLRQSQRLVGSKEGCAEGDCGACTVVLGELVEDQLQLRAVNACIQFVPTLNGKALFTVEYLRQTDGSLHPIQQAMVDQHGSQCGFCTPGFVMSLWAVYVEKQAQQATLEEAEIRTTLSGNLCRCTGYRSILAAGVSMLDYPQVAIDKPELEKALREIQQTESLCYVYKDESFCAPRSLDELTILRGASPDATLVAGSTDVGLWVNKKLQSLGDIIYLGEVSELKRCALRDVAHDEINSDTDGEIDRKLRLGQQELVIGATVSLTEAFEFLVQYYPQLEQQWQRFASLPIRNAGTLGGNVANGSPIGDSMPWLIALGASVELVSQSGRRRMPLEAFYLDYMQQDLQIDEVVSAVIVNKPSSDREITQCFRTYKLAKRYDSDISAVCAAFCLELDDERISKARIAFGGVAAIPKRATKTETVLVGKSWNEATVKEAMLALSEDYSPLSDMRASAENRAQSVQNLLYRFYLETRQNEPLDSSQVTVYA